MNFDVSAKDHSNIVKLAQTAHRLAKSNGFVYTVQDAAMDLTACHANGCPLRLADMVADYESADVIHDLFGIRRHLDRTTGKLTGFFVPRYAAPE